LRLIWRDGIYKQLTKEQRYQIAALKKAGHSNKEIAENIGTSEPTISREFKRNTGKRGYRPKQAHIKALWRKKNTTKAIKMTAKAHDYPQFAPNVHNTEFF
jgi:transposase, IS30 family